MTKDTFPAVFKVRPGERHSRIFRLKSGAAVACFHYPGFPWGVIWLRALSNIRSTTLRPVDPASRARTGLMPVFSRQGLHFFIRNIRWIADDNIILPVPQRAVQVRFDQIDSLCQVVSFTIDARHFQRIRIDIRRIDRRAGEGRGTSHCDTAAAGAQVQDMLYFRGFDPG